MVSPSKTESTAQSFSPTMKVADQPSKVLSYIGGPAAVIAAVVLYVAYKRYRKRQDQRSDATSGAPAQPAAAVSTTQKSEDALGSDDEDETTRQSRY